MNLPDNMNPKIESGQRGVEEIYEKLNDKRGIKNLVEKIRYRLKLKGVLELERRNGRRRWPQPPLLPLDLAVDFQFLVLIIINQ